MSLLGELVLISKYLCCCPRGGSIVLEMLTLCQIVPPVPLMLSPAEIVPQQPPQSELIFSVLNIPRLLQRKLISTQRSELTLPTVQNRHQTLPPRLDLGALLVNIFVGSEVRVGAGGCLLVFVVLLTW